MDSRIQQRWGKTWGPEADSNFPWWRQAGGVIQRCDGAFVHNEPANPQDARQTGGVQAWYTLADGTTVRLGARRDVTVEASMRHVDATHPLFRPDVMAGQTWAWVDDDGALHERVVWSVVLDASNHVPAAAGEALPAHAALVAGPSCYGFNVPWFPKLPEGWKGLMGWGLTG